MLRVFDKYQEPAQASLNKTTLPIAVHRCDIFKESGHRIKIGGKWQPMRVYLCTVHCDSEAELTNYLNMYVKTELEKAE